MRDRVEDRGLGDLGAARRLCLGGPFVHPLPLDGDVDSRPSDSATRSIAPGPTSRRRSGTASRCRRACATAPYLVRHPRPAPARARRGRAPRRSRARRGCRSSRAARRCSRRRGSPRRPRRRAWPHARGRRPASPGSRPRRRARGPRRRAGRPRRPRSAARSARPGPGSAAIASRWRGTMKKKLSASTPRTAVTSAASWPLRIAISSTASRYRLPRPGVVGRGRLERGNAGGGEPDHDQDLDAGRRPARIAARSSGRASCIVGTRARTRPGCSPRAPSRSRQSLISAKATPPRSGRR